MIYPIPEVGFNVPKGVIENSAKNKFKILSTSYEVYKNRTKSSFELLNNIIGQNISRVFPAKYFCNTVIKNRCVVNDEKDIFYFNDNHPSNQGASLINKSIINIINQK